MTQRESSFWIKVGLALMLLGIISTWAFGGSSSPYHTCEPFTGCGFIGLSTN